MGYYLTLIYITVSFLTPTLTLGPLADLRPEVFLVILSLLFSVPGFADSGVLKTTQTLAIAGMCFAVVLSVLFIGGFGALGSAGESFYGFLQPTLLFYLVAVNCKKKWHLQGIVLALVCGSFIYIYLGFMDLHANVAPSLYLFGEGDLRRLRGLGFVNDPNDFAQVLVSLVPCLFLWYSKNPLAYVAFVFVPLAALLFGTYLTHSRGASLALMVVLLLSIRKKIGTIPAAIIAGLLLAATLALGWSGGRDISMDAGADRLDLWAGGLVLIKTHPLFGVGPNRFAEYEGITAHNTIVVCAAELGLFGFYFWVLFIFSAFRSGFRLGKAGIEIPKPEPAAFLSRGADFKASTHTDLAAYPESAYASTSRSATSFAGPAEFTRPGNMKSVARVEPDSSAAGRYQRQELGSPDEEIARMARLLVYALSGMLTAGWFLSRAYSQWLFMFCGMLYAVVRMARGRPFAPQRDPLSFLFRWTGVTAVGLLGLVYAILRYRNLAK